MQITSSGSQTVEIRTRDVAIRLAETVQLGTFVIPGPGEYEVGGVMADVGRRTMRLETSELVVGYLRPGTMQAPNDHDLEELGAVDLAVVPVGGASLTVKDAAVAISQLDTNLVLVLPDTPATLATLGKAGVSTTSQAGAWKVTRSQLPTEGTTVVALAAT